MAVPVVQFLRNGYKTDQANKDLEADRVFGYGDVQGEEPTMSSIHTVSAWMSPSPARLSAVFRPITNNVRRLDHAMHVDIQERNPFSTNLYYDGMCVEGDEKNCQKVLLPRRNCVRDTLGKRG